MNIYLIFVSQDVSNIHVLVT